MIYDTFFGTLGDRQNRPYDRVWIEDSCGRLTRNGFTAGSAFAVNQRAGVGLVLTPAAVGYTVTPRRGAALISFEARGLAERLATRELRVRVCVKSIAVMPVLRRFYVRRFLPETWAIAGQVLTTGGGNVRIDSPIPWRAAGSPEAIHADLCAENIVFATEVFGNAKPAKVVLTGDLLLRNVAGQFLAATGYTSADDGVWRR